MALSVTVVIREDPRKTHRAVEALRIALGLSTGPNPMTVVLLDEAPRILTDDIDEFIDADLLEKHLPILKELGILFVVPQSTNSRYRLNPDFVVRESSVDDISRLITQSDRVLAF